MLNFRLFGHSIQSTALTFSYGLRTREMTDPDKIRLAQQFGQAALQLYLTKYFGLDAKYRQFQPTHNDDMGDVTENLAEAGVFIDFNFLRLYGSYYQSRQKAIDTVTEVETLTNRTGIKSGIKIFF
jgi:hypothetical protein